MEVLKAFEGLAENVPPVVKDGDYVDSEGFLRCSHCDTRKQTQLSFFIGETLVERKVYCMCACEAEEMEAREAWWKKQEIKRTVQINRRAGFPAKVYEKWTFDTDDKKNPQASATAMEYAEAFNRGTNTGLLLYGQRGTGKTFLSACIANYLLDRGFTVVLTNVKRISNVVNATWDKRQDELDRVLDADLLILDDLGTERRSPYMNEQVFDIVDGRYKSGLPMIVSTNMTFSQMRNEQSDEYGRIYDRILENCFPVEFNGVNRRLVAADANRLSGWKRE